MGVFRERIAIDLGTAYSLVAHEFSDELWSVPSSIAVDAQTKKPVAYGEVAKNMLGKGSNHYEVIHPMRDGVISDFQAAGHYLAYLVKNSRRNPLALQYSILMCIPWSATAVEIKSYRERVRSLRTDLRLIREPFAAALGCDQNIFSEEGCTVVDMGGGTVEISTIAHGHMIQCTSVREAGNAMDQLIQEKMLRHKLFDIGRNTAEDLKIKFGSVFEEGEDYDFDVMGLSRRHHAPGRLTLNTKELRAFLEPLVLMIEGRIRHHIRHLPPEFQRATAEKGLHLVGGGAHLRGWKTRLENRLGFKVHISETPQLAVIRGLRRVIRQTDKYESILKISEKVS